MGYASKKPAVAKKVAKVLPSTRSNGELRPHEKEVKNRLRRVEGQIRGVLSMMDRELPCHEIAQQLSAARKALDRAFFEMMACSLEMEVDKSASKKAMRDNIAEKAKLLAKYS